MKAASILLALVVVSGFVRKAGAFELGPPDYLEHDYTFSVGGHWFGFCDRTSPDGKRYLSVVHLGGPVTQWVNSPFSATQGLVGFCIITVGMLALVTVFTFRWKRKRAA